MSVIQVSGLVDNTVLDKYRAEVIILIDLILKGKQVDERFRLKTDMVSFSGTINAEEAMQESEHGDANEHIMILVLDMEEAFWFTDPAGEQVQAKQIHLADERLLNHLSSPGRHCKIKGAFYRAHNRLHHKQVVADEIEIIE